MTRYQNKLVRLDPYNDRDEAQIRALHDGTYEPALGWRVVSISTLPYCRGHRESDGVLLTLERVVEDTPYRG